ncbi:unnamed protein product [[Actinomadura] parvosata subsp. kistnae]|uniref:hypothetical protein n=1 Tax=[Actinomadura] parvosata TaxID=1955412 RepID=UPI000D2AC4BF|nr:unnamed protein product [Actinomadura parvosata subsp. kistnae]
MNRLREALGELAADAPAVDLADWAVEGSHRRRRARLAAGSAGAMALVVLVGVLLYVPGLPQDAKPIVAVQAAAVPDLPGRGVGPLSHALRTFCHVGGPIPPDCRDGEWRVVTRSGETYHVPQAMTSGHTFSPLAISRDGRVIAYYSRQAATFKVRDLAGGAERTAPVTIPVTKLGRNPRLQLSDDGRYLAYTDYWSGKDGLVIDMRMGTTLPLPAGWDPRSVSGTAVTLARSGLFGQRPGIWVMPLTGGGSPVTLGKAYKRFSALAPDGATVAALGQASAPMFVYDGTITLLDTRTGRAKETATIRGLPEGTRPLDLGSWLNAAEVTLSALPSTSWKETRHITYAVNVRTGQARQLAIYHPQSVMHDVIPGAGTPAW